MLKQNVDVTVRTRRQHLHVKIKLRTTFIVSFVVGDSDKLECWCDCQIKTTAPEGYRVRPSLGIVQPQATGEADIFLQPGKATCTWTL